MPRMWHPRSMMVKDEFTILWNEITYIEFYSPMTTQKKECGCYLVEWIYRLQEDPSFQQDY